MGNNTSVGASAPYTTMTIARHGAVGWNKGTTAILLDEAEGNTLEEDLIEKPEGGVAPIMSDEFFNIHDKTGPGMTNYKP